MKALIIFAAGVASGVYLSRNLKSIRIVHSNGTTTLAEWIFPPEVTRDV